jgi:hypothetical protein
MSDRTIHTKVPHSLHSLQSSRSSGGGPKPAVPPKKRQKLADFMSTRDPYAQLGNAFGEAGPSNYIMANSTTKSAVAKGKERETTVEDSDAGSITPVPSFMDQDSQYGSFDDSRDDRASSRPGVPNPFETEDDWYDSSSWISSENASSVNLLQRERRIDSSRCIETFSDDEITDMKLAADFLISLLFSKEAFPLYVLVLKRMKHDRTQHSGQMQAAFVACVHSAATAPQIEIAQSLLRQALEGKMGTLTDAEKFVFRNLLADTYKRLRKFDTAISETTLAWRSAPSIENLSLFLPQGHRSLDLVFYHQVTRTIRNYDYFVYNDIPDEDSPQPSDQNILRQTQVQDQCIQQSPGPFELKDHQLQNPCLRSCMEWCTKELEQCSSELRAWKSLLPKWKEQPGFQFRLKGSARTVNSNAIRLLKWISLYCYLWQRWQLLRSQSFNQSELLWAEQAEERMGIPASEILATISTLILYDVQYDYNDSPRQLALPALICAKRLSGLSDRELANKFFESLSWKSDIEMFSESENGSSLLHLLAWRGIYTDKNASKGHRAGFNTARVYVIEFIEKNLALLLPEAHSAATSIASTPHNLSRESLQIVAATLLPTLASSLKSSNLSSLRKLRDRIQQGTKDAMQDASNAAASAKTSMDLQSISDLSQAVSSLNLAPLRDVSSSALELLTTASSNMRNRMGD